MFNLKAQNGKSIILREMAINTYKVGALKIEIYVKRGNYKGYEMNRNAWTLWASPTVVGRGSGNPTRIPPSKFPRMERNACFLYQMWQCTRSVSLVNEGGE